MRKNDRDIPGRDYVPVVREVTRTRAEWQVLMAAGRRRAERDDVGPVTYIHGADGTISHEIYENVPAA